MLPFRKFILFTIVAEVMCYINARPILNDANINPKEIARNGNVIAPLIVGGSDAQIGAYPYYTEFEISTASDPDPSRCGGALITPEVVLTAAHCFDGEAVTAVNAFVGAYNHASTANGAVLRTCTDFVFHPSFIPLRLSPTTGGILPGTGVLGGNDLALCRLNATVPIDTTDVYLELNDDNNLPAVNQTLAVMGFGFTSSNRTNLADILQDVELPVYDDNSCEIELASRDIITDTMMCAWDETQQRAECGGDSGSPLVLSEIQPDGRLRHIAFGLVSFSGPVCGQSPGVFARISTGMDFIRERVCVTWGLEAIFCATAEPSNQPSVSANPSASPSDAPSRSPSHVPSGKPTSAPSNQPSGSPSRSPSRSPSGSPSGSPSVSPSGSPLESPSDSPSASPSDIPSEIPSNALSGIPSSSPTDKPSASPIYGSSEQLSKFPKKRKKRDAKSKEPKKEEKKTKNKKSEKKETEKSLRSRKKNKKSEEKETENSLNSIKKNKKLEEKKPKRA